MRKAWVFKFDQPHVEVPPVRCQQKVADQTTKSATPMAAKWLFFTWNLTWPCFGVLSHIRRDMMILAHRNGGRKWSVWVYIFWWQLVFPVQTCPATSQATHRGSITAAEQKAVRGAPLVPCRGYPIFQICGISPNPCGKQRSEHGSILKLQVVIGKNCYWGSWPTYRVLQKKTAIR